MEEFNKAYDQKILPKYRQNEYGYDYDKDGSKPNLYRVPIQDRLDLTGLRCYTIDPDGCQDADDGFSIWTVAEDESRGRMFLGIHIADPTYFFSPDSECFNKILSNGLTHYPSGHQPNHMMPAEVVQMASLMDGIKPAISIVVEIDQDTFDPIGEIKVYMTLVNCDPKYRFTYKTAGNMDSSQYNSYSDYLSCVQDFRNCLNIADAMRGARRSAGKKLAEVNQASFEEDSHGLGEFNLVTEQPNVVKMKQMIAEFAIFANSAIAQYLQLNLAGYGIFRVCDAGQEVGNISEDDPITGKELLKLIVQNGLSASYIATVDSHDLVGLPSYCHFTSPIRRATDCICHYLVKAACLQIAPPFNQNWLSLISNKLDYISKEERKIRYDDIKFRTVQSIYKKLMNNKEGLTIALGSDIGYKIGYVKIKVRVTGYTGLFLNMILEQIDEEIDISVSYVLRVGYEYPKSLVEYFMDNPVHVIRVTNVNVPGNFDQGTFPEIDQFMTELKLGV